MPDEWRRSVIIPLYKGKKDIKECGNYRGIKLMSHTMKLWERIIELRIRKEVTITEQQFGFMPGRSTTDAIFCLRMLLEKWTDNSDGIIKFPRDFYDCELTCGSRPESGLDSQQVVGKVFDRLPRSLQEKFIMSVFFQLEKGHPITFSQLSQFMQKQYHVERSFLNQIVKSKDTNTTKFNFSKKSCNRPGVYSTQSSIAPYSVVESALVKTNQFREVYRKHKSCPMCVQAHPLWKCLKF